MTSFFASGIKRRRSKADFAPTWRRWRDSNSRALLHAYRISSADPSTTWVHLLICPTERVCLLCHTLLTHASAASSGGKISAGRNFGRRCRIDCWRQLFGKAGSHCGRWCSSGACRSSTGITGGRWQRRGDGPAYPGTCRRPAGAMPCCCRAAGTWSPGGTVRPTLPAGTWSRNGTRRSCSCWSGSQRRAGPVSYTHLRAHETPRHLLCRLLLEKK